MPSFSSSPFLQYAFTQSVLRVFGSNYKTKKLFGHEIVAILCGLVWGLWVGFGIVAAGTFLGEVGNF